MSTIFHVKDHIIDGQHIREYPNATANSQNDILQIVVRQYIPRNNPTPQKGDITIIATHANGFVKELYEPLWHDLLQELERRGTRVRSIWMAECAWQGQSGVINETKLGNDPSWLDHARDMLLMVNQFRREMPQPIVGVAHSFGANILVNLSLMHPRLFHHLILIDPVLLKFEQVTERVGILPLMLSTARRDLWETREKAAESFRARKFYQMWDPRVLDALISHGLRDTPTAIHPKAGHVTLTTTKHQEVFTYLRPLAQKYDGEHQRTIDRNKVLDTNPDLWTEAFPQAPFYRAECPNTAAQLPHLRPSVFYIHGGTSDVCTPAVRKMHLEDTGSGIGGSGGAKAGKVAATTFEKHGHVLAFEIPGECARLAAESVQCHLERWHSDEADYQSWRAKPTVQKQTIDRHLQGLVRALAQARSKL